MFKQLAGFRCTSRTADQKAIVSTSNRLASPSVLASALSNAAPFIAGSAFPFSGKIARVMSWCVASHWFVAIFCRRSTSASNQSRLPTRNRRRRRQRIRRLPDIEGHADDRQATDRQIRRLYLIGDHITRFSADLVEKR